MNNYYNKYSNSDYDNLPQYDYDMRADDFMSNQGPNFTNTPMNNLNLTPIVLKDYGPNPFVINIVEATKQNENYRTTLWTGAHLQLTLMSIPVGGEIGLERHPNLDQFIRIEEGEGLVKMGNKENSLDFQEKVQDDFIFIIPAGTWHNLVNTGDKPIKLYSIYAPPQHPFGTVHKTKAESDAAERNQRYYENQRSYSRHTKEFTLSELAYFDGLYGKPAYLAINGVVYDISNDPRWREYMVHGLAAGRDATSQFKYFRGLEGILTNVPRVGILIE